MLTFLNCYPLNNGPCALNSLSFLTWHWSTCNIFSEHISGKIIFKTPHSKKQLEFNSPSQWWDNKLSTCPYFWTWNSDKAIPKNYGMYCKYKCCHFTYRKENVRLIFTLVQNTAFHSMYKNSHYCYTPTKLMYTLFNGNYPF